MLFCFFYYRFIILLFDDKVGFMFDRINKFYKEFMDKYRDDNDNDKL